MIGIIAGAGSLPIAACHTLKKQQQTFCVISLASHDNGIALQQIAGSKEVIPLAFYKISTILDQLKKLKVTHVLMIGKFDKKQLLQQVKFDWLAVKLLASVMYKTDQDLLQRIVDELSSHGINVLKQHEVLVGLLTKPGILTGHIDNELQQNINFGMQVANDISKLDIGQTVAIKDRMILAVEAIEGTDACIKRSIELGGGKVIICKSAQAAHNPQFDLPTLGSTTLQSLKPGQVQAIAWLASHTLIADRDAFIKAAQDRDITLVAI
ncbi:LpxI family protein [Candidatus Dependentiae bacterium]|nr:LpxI family protein [Candidatus Dependentiae bacterium]